MGVAGWTILLAVVAYLVCGIPFGKIVAARMAGVDIRSVGSGNIGTTNVAREVGKGAAALTLLLDVLKGFVCTFAAFPALSLVTGMDPSAFAPDAPGGLGLAPSMVFAACVLGHIFSPYLRFHGGKGIAVGFGAALGLCWPVALGLLLVFVVFAVPTRYVSLGSIAAAASLPVWCLVLGFSPVAVIPELVVAVVVIWAHRANIGRLLSHQERRFSFHRAGEKDGRR